MKNMIIVGAVLLPIFITSCDGDSDSDERAFDCPDVIEYADPLLSISSVVDSSRNEPLIQVTLSDLQIDGEDTQFSDLSSQHMENIDIISDGTAAVCTTPCALFTRESEYSFVIGTPSYEPQRVTLSPTYDSFNTDSCPITYSGSHELEVQLDPA